MSDDLTKMTDDELRAYVREHVYAAALFVRHSVHDDNCSAALAECERRGRPWVYQRGYNSALRDAGETPSEFDLERARPPLPAPPATLPKD